MTGGSNPPFGTKRKMECLSDIKLKKVFIVALILFSVASLAMLMCDWFNANRWVGVPDADGEGSIDEVFSRCTWYGKVVFAIGYIWFFSTVISIFAVVMNLTSRFVDKIVPEGREQVEENVDEL